MYSLVCAVAVTLLCGIVPVILGTREAWLQLLLTEGDHRYLAAIRCSSCWWECK